MERDGFSDAVETAIKQVTVFENEDLDLADFDPVEYINRQFPSEASLDGLDAFIAKTDQEIKFLNSSISDSVREQSTAGLQAARELKKAKESIAELFGKIRDIRFKAEQSEQMVQDICKDIRQLDVAKRHLTTTIIMLKRVQMLVSAVDSLQGLLSSGSYDNAGQLLLAVGQLLTNFKAYSSVPKVADLMATVNKIKSTFYDRIMRDFESLTELGVAEAMSASDGGPGRDSAALQALRQACDVVDALDIGARDTLIKAFCTKQLRPFEGIRQSEEGKALESLGGRYAWFRRAVRDMDGRYGSVLPKPWRMAQRLYLEFLRVTRMDVEKMLSKYSVDTVPANVLVKALMQTQQFEKEMRTKFDAEEAKLRETGGLESADRARRDWLVTLSKDGALSGIPSGGAMPLPPDMSDCIISDVFVPYLAAYVSWERSKMEEKYRDVVGDTTGPLDAFPSAAQLLQQVKNSVTRCSHELGLTGQPLYQLSTAVKGCIQQYADQLLALLPPPISGGPFPGDTFKIEPTDLHNLCMILKTAMYMAETVPNLGESIRSLIDDAYKEHVLFTDLQEYYQFEVVSKAMRVLSSGAACMLDDALIRLCKRSWVTVSDVGDQSDYVDMIGLKLREVVPLVRSSLSEEHFVMFCDKLARAFMPRYMQALYACKRIGEFGAQQMLLDTVAIREIFLQVPSMVGEDEEPIAIEAPMFVKFVSREVPRVELLLKLVSTPKERFGESVKALWPDVSASDLSRVMELRNMKSSEQREVLEFLGLSAAASSGSSMKSALGMFRDAGTKILQKK